MSLALIAVYKAAQGVLSFFRTAWGKRVLVALVVLAVGAGGFTYGRYRTPPRIVTKVEIKENTVTVVKEVEKVREVKVAARARKTVVHRVVRETRQPDGTATKVTETVATADTHQVTSAATTADLTADVTQHTELQRTDTPTVVAPAGGSVTRPDWSVGALVGTQINVRGGPVFGPVLYGARVERRIVGPIYVGIWGVSNGTVGGSLSVSW